MASSALTDFLEENPAVDYGVVLEGEQTLLELCRGVDPARISGLLYRDDSGAVTYTGDRPFEEQLDSLQFPRYRMFDQARYSRLITIVTSRGCPYGCIYCPVNLAIGRKLRFRSATNVVDEIEYHYKRGYREFSFRDDNFTFKETHVYAICDEIEKRGLSGLHLMCDNGIRADKAEYSLLARMKEVGFTMLGFGIEH